MLRAAISALLLSVAAPALAADGDMPVKSPAGIAVTQPKDWAAKAMPNAIILNAPEGDFPVALVDVGAAADAKAATAAAWKIYRLAANRAVLIVTPRPARDGWDERAVVDYDVAPNEKVAVQAIAYRKGTSWTVLIFEGSMATAGKRGAALNVIGQSVRPAGYVKEDLTGKTPSPITIEKIEMLHAFVAQSIEKLGIPGASFALTDGSKTLYAGGIGVRELGKPAAVDEATRFMIASNTKGMATLLLAQMVDAGKVAWDDPVTKAYPTFRLGSDATTKQVLIRHLVCACTGLPRKDMQWLLNTTKAMPANQTFIQLAATQPTSGFGELYQYNNLMASAAGYVAAHLANPKVEIGKAFDSAMATRIFKPLGMVDTGFTLPTTITGNFAQPYGDGIDGKPTLAAMSFNDTIHPYRPAGAAWSSARDLIRYVQLELNEGVLPNGKRLVSKENLLKRRARSVPMGETSWYGMGLIEDSIGGVPFIHHGGSMIGYKSDIMLIPSAKIGAVILTNSDNGGALLRPFLRRLVELMYDAKPEAYADVEAAAARRGPEMAAIRAKLTIPADPVAVATLASAYTNEDLGRLTVKRDKGELVFAATSGESRAASRKNEDGTTSFVWTDPAFQGLDFVTGTKDGKPALILRDAQHEYVFVPVTK